ncbi:Bidirectional sugar transporter SWEET13 [Platanthera guangdongensis]|uniref:Bidirectional sugar transporter SWEET13 n=1 Tax=Platanthera guangdongensis TaxID=2320717 RepID=A0ABR2MA75_9ASPA
MLWVYYACVKSNALLLLTINFIGCVIEIGYIIMYLIYAPRTAKQFAQLPNILDLVLEILQMVLYCVYKDAKLKRVVSPINVTVVPTIVTLNAMKLPMQKKVV